MTRFMWWTVVWFGLALLSDAVYMHFAGGYAAYRSAHTKDARGFGALVLLALYFVLWFAIVSKEPR